MKIELDTKYNLNDKVYYLNYEHTHNDFYSTEMIWRVIGVNNPYSHDLSAPLSIKAIQIKIDKEGNIQEYYLLKDKWIELSLIYNSFDDAKQKCDEQNGEGWW